MNDKLEKLRILQVLLSELHGLGEPLFKIRTLALLNRTLNALGFYDEGFRVGDTLLDSAKDENITTKAFASMCFAVLDNMEVALDNIRCAGEGSLVILNTKAYLKKIRGVLYVSI